MFLGSVVLLVIFDNFKEIKIICWCGCKVIMVVWFDGDGKIVEEGD